MKVNQFQEMLARLQAGGIGGGFVQQPPPFRVPAGATPPIVPVREPLAAVGGGGFGTYQLGQQPTVNQNLTPGPGAGTITNAPPVGGNPFNTLVNQIPASSWGNPNAQAWTQQALGGPWMAGWGPPQQPGTMPGGGAAPGAPGASPSASAGPRLASDIAVSPEARKIFKQFKKAKANSSWDLKDIGMLAGSVALGVATGGTSLAGQIAGGALSGAGSAFGSHQGNKAIGGQLKKVKKLREEGMTQAGYTRGPGGDYVDAQGNKLGGAKVFQVLYDMGLLGG